MVHRVYEAQRLPPFPRTVDMILLPLNRLSLPPSFCMYVCLSVCLYLSVCACDK